MVGNQQTMKATEIMRLFPHTTTNAQPVHVETILKNLEAVIKSEVEGSVVELGCHQGLTSVYIQRLLDALESKKEYHCYDSFEGLPDKHEKDGIDDHFVKGLFNNITKQTFIDYFSFSQLKLPIIHEGWFNEATYPDKICFAFLDGDLYQSILDSLTAVMPRLVTGRRRSGQGILWHY
jgi:O-methyltransferase